MAGFPSPDFDEQARRLLEDFQIGNFIYFSRNMQSAAQVSALSQTLSWHVFDKLGIAPLIAADQEGGMVSRITEGAALIPSAAAVAAAVGGSAEGGSAEENPVRQLGRNLGEILRAMGVNMNLAPVMDLNMDPANPIIGCRSYGDNPEKAAALGISMMQGLVDGGVLPVLKHFPGHGNVSSDSHLGIPVNHQSRERLEATEWAAFQKGIQAGAPAILTAHVRYEQVDAENPATLSPAIVTGLLRQQWGFDGLVLTDCMEMDAVRASCGTGEGAVRAIEAGADMVTISHTYEAVQEAVLAIYAALESGRLSPERVEISYQRIQRCKEKLGLFTPQAVDAEQAEKVLLQPAKLILNREMAADSITLLSGESVQLSEQKPDFLVIAPDSMAATGVEDSKPISLADRAAARFGCLAAKMPLDGDAAQAATMLDSAVKMGFKTVVLGLFNARMRPGQQEVLRKIEEMPGVRLIVALLGAPYDASLVHRADAVIAAYDYTALGVEALLDALASGRYVGHCPFQLTKL